MRIRLNGKDSECSGGTVAALLESHKVNAGSVVVERNGAIVHRQEYGVEKIVEGDVVEVVRLVGGG